MSVCVVAEYPFPQDKMVGGTPYGAIVCSDTKITSPGRTIKLLAAKQGQVSENVLVCYTSSNFAVTRTALNASTNRRACLKRLGGHLKSHHEKWGSLTELLAVVWHKNEVSPTVLEVMPKMYEPRVRKGIVGIGDRGVLARCKELLDEYFASDKAQIPMTLEALEGLSKAGANVAGFSFETALLNAATPLAAALDQAIDEVRSPTVGTPIVVNVIVPRTGVHRWGAFTKTLRDENAKWESMTAAPKDVVIPNGPLVRTPPWLHDLSAVQLVEPKYLKPTQDANASGR